MQPSCDGVTAFEQEPDPPQPKVTWLGLEPAAWAWLALVLGIVIFDVWALHHGTPTMSQWTQRLPLVWRILGTVAFAVLTIHLFFGLDWVR